MSTFMKSDSSSIAKRVEKEIATEAKKEHKSVKHALKALEKLEKTDSKVQRRAEKAERALGKGEKREQSTLHDLHKATQRHDEAAAKVRNLSREVDNLHKEQAKHHQALQAKKVDTERAIKAKNIHEQSRLRRLAEVQDSPTIDGDVGEVQTMDGEIPISSTSYAAADGA